jgi:hypothetical protein
MQTEMKIVASTDDFDTRVKTSKMIWRKFLIYPIAATIDLDNSATPKDKALHSLTIKKNQLGEYGDIEEERGDFEMNDFIMKAKSVEFLIDYPLDNPAHLTITGLPEDKLTPHLICKSVSEAYHEIYRIEDQGMEIAKSQEVGGITFLNRPNTDGMFGIWGHGITDLVIERLTVFDEGNGHVLVGLDIGS